MAIRNSWETNNKTYLPDETIFNSEVEIASILFLCGKDINDIDALTIDEMVEAVRETYEYRARKDSSESIGPEHLISLDATRISVQIQQRTNAGLIIGKHSFHLQQVLRRNMRWRKIAKYVKENYYV